MRERAEARQRSRLNRAIEMMATAPLQQMRFPKGAVVYRQGEPATHFYIVKGGELATTFVSTIAPKESFSSQLPLGLALSVLVALARALHRAL